MLSTAYALAAAEPSGASRISSHSRASHSPDAPSAARSRSARRSASASMLRSATTSLAIMRAVDVAIEATPVESATVIAGSSVGLP